MPEVKPPPKKAKRTSGEFTPTWARKAAGGRTAPRESPPRDGWAHDEPAKKEPENGFHPAWGGF
jgi:hypothetical protein